MHARTVRGMSKDTRANVHALVVDDGPAERTAARTMPAKPGFSVTTVASGDEALRVLADVNVGLGLCGTAMSDASSLSLPDCARAQQQVPQSIMSTNYNEAEQGMDFLHHGAGAYLSKPLCFGTLHSAITDALATFRRKLGDLGFAQPAAQPLECDSLTGLMSKNAFVRRLHANLHNTSIAAECGVVVLLKIRGLSYINHSYGFAAGDRVLHFAARSLQHAIRTGDLIGRIDGDLFALYLASATHAHAEATAMAIVENVETGRLALGDDQFSLAIIAGGACAYGSMDVDELLNRADLAMHLARDRGRDHVRFYSAADEAHKLELSQQLNTLAVVRAALSDRARLTMHYQPIINLSSGSVSHFEALLRVHDDSGKPCPAGELVKTCEVFGLIGSVDRAVVCACLAGIGNVPDGAGVAINLSGKSIGDPDLLQLIENEIGARAIDPARIIFELTETAAFHNLDEVRHFVRRIKNLGCRFALDDFGVGFSSFYYIREFEFDYLKLDGSFIVNLRTNPSDQVFVRAMVEISRVFGLAVIAEWVEDRETAEMLHGFGVDFGQGYHFGAARPLPALT